MARMRTKAVAGNREDNKAGRDNCKDDKVRGGDDSQDN